jgi:hypothetical protein
MRRHLVIVEERFVRRQPAVMGCDYMEEIQRRRNAEAH